MKIEFQEPAAVQPPVAPVQEENRRSRPRKVPVLRGVLLVLLLAVLALSVRAAIMQRRIYAYGLVAGANDTYTAPFQGVLRNLRVLPGDTVNPGQELFELAPLEYSALDQTSAGYLDKLAGLREANMARQKEIVDAARLALDALTSPTMAGATPEDLQYAAALAELRRVQAEARAAEARRQVELGKARIEVQKLTRFMEARKARHDQLVQLQAMDAAVGAEVRTARGELEMAEANLEQARQDLKAAEAGAFTTGELIASAQAGVDVAAARRQRSTLEQARARAELATLLKEQDLMTLDVERAQFNMAVATGGRVPVRVTAPYRATVVEIGASEGAMVAPGQTLVGLAASGKYWINAYLKPDRVGKVRTGSRVRIYVDGVKAPLEGKVAVAGSAVLPVPQPLRRHMPNQDLASYVRVDVNVPQDTPLRPGALVRLVLAD